MSQYRLIQLDRRFRMHSAGFELALEWSWPASSNRFSIDHPWQEQRRYEHAAQRALGTAYYQYANPRGAWSSQYRRHTPKNSIQETVEERLFIRSERHLMLVQLAL
jgi:hypothetical protein